MSEQKIFIAILAYVLISLVKNPFIIALIIVVAIYLLSKKDKPAVLHGANDHQWIVDNLNRNIAKDEVEREKERLVIADK